MAPSNYLQIPFDIVLHVYKYDALETMYMSIHDYIMPFFVFDIPNVVLSLYLLPFLCHIFLLLIFFVDHTFDREPFFFRNIFLCFDRDCINGVFIDMP